MIQQWIWIDIIIQKEHQANVPKTHIIPAM